jgi:hypothetical protein
MLPEIGSETQMHFRRALHSASATSNKQNCAGCVRRCMERLWHDQSKQEQALAPIYWLVHEGFDTLRSC